MYVGNLGTLHSISGRAWSEYQDGHPLESPRSNLRNEVLSLKVYQIYRGSNSKLPKKWPFIREIQKSESLAFSISDAPLGKL